MCGIAGAMFPAAQHPRELVGRMCTAMVARGPDDGGLASFPAGRFEVSLGSRRLAIIDPSERGHQPFPDPQRGSTVAFNGMIYNYREIQQFLRREGHRFASDCDTEVVLRAYQQWGEDFVTHLHGMFALAVWDERESKLILARDRLGIKPLYYAQRDGRFLFASQVKALVAGGAVPADLSPEAIETFLTFGAVSEPLTAIRGVYALGAGQIATVKDSEMNLRTYWSLPAPGTVAVADAAQELRALLTSAVKSHLVADAPLGVFLSGGIDSSIVAALAAAGGSDVTTISVDFAEPSYSEGHYIDLMRQQLSGTHERVMFGSQDLEVLRTEAFAAMDQPSVDGINTYIVSRAAASRGLKVALSGLGADELFDGYRHAQRVKTMERIRPFARPVAGLLRRMPEAVQPGEKLRAWLYGEGYAGGSWELLRRALLPSDVRRLMRGSQGDTQMAVPAALSSSAPLARQVLDREVEGYLRNMLLRDTDAMSMANSLEVRVPFLDDQLVDWTARLSPDLRMPGKGLLIAAVGDLLPVEIVTRQKRGFQLPFEPWLRGPLRAHANEEFANMPARLQEVIDPQVAYGVWQDYVDTGSRWMRPWLLYSLIRWVAALDDTPAPRAGPPSAPRL